MFACNRRDSKNSDNKEIKELDPKDAQKNEKGNLESGSVKNNVASSEQAVISFMLFGQ